MTHRLHTSGRVALAAVLALMLHCAAQAQVVTRDAQSGQLRPATASEIKALEAQAARSGKAQAPAGLISGRASPPAVQLPSGAVMQELDTDSLMYSVARRNADGSITQDCVAGSDAVQKLMKAPMSKARTVVKAGKEQTYELK